MQQRQNSRRFTLKALTVATALGAFGLTAHAADTIKVGVLHSLSARWPFPRPCSRTWP